MKKLFFIFIVILFFLQSANALAYREGESNHRHECCFFENDSNNQTTSAHPNLPQNNFYHRHMENMMNMRGDEFMHAMPCHSRNSMERFLKIRMLRGIVQKK